MAKEKTYSEQLKSPKWQKKRLEILERDKFQCQCCGDEDSQLHVHHKKYVFGKMVWDYEDKDLITFCMNCHESVSSMKKDIKGIIDDCFVYTDDLGELHDIMTYIYCFNPYDLSMVAKYCRKIYQKKAKNK